MFVDLRGFTAFAETAEPEEVMGVLRESRREMGDLSCGTKARWSGFTGYGRNPPRR